MNVAYDIGTRQRQQIVVAFEVVPKVGESLAAIGVLGAVSVATACVLPDSVALGIASVPDGQTKHMSIEHPSGEFSVELSIDDEGNVIRAGLLRTARLLSRGQAYYQGGAYA